MALSASHLRKFDERSVPRSRPDGIHLASRPRHGGSQVAYLSSPHETPRATSILVERRARLDGIAFKCLVGRERRRPRTRFAKNRISASDECSRTLLIGRA